MNYVERRKKIFSLIHARRAANRIRGAVMGGRADRCADCGKKLEGEAAALACCPHCGHHMALSAEAHLRRLLDDCELLSLPQPRVNPLSFPGFEEKKIRLQEETGLDEAVLVSRGRLGDEKVIAFAMDKRFLMGSMGMVVGHRVALAFRLAVEEGLPVLGITASGGARMQEGIYALMQMAHTTAAVRAHSDAGLFYTCLMTDPTTGGVSASFASLADVILAEPGARICFTGRRVIESTIGEKLPEGFQSAAFVRDHGFLDDIVSRLDQKDYLTRLFHHHRRMS